MADICLRVVFTNASSMWNFVENSVFIIAILFLVPCIDEFSEDKINSQNLKHFKLNPTLVEYDFKEWRGKVFYVGVFLGSF